MEEGDHSFEWFKDAFHGLSGIDLHYYKEAQMERRIGVFMRRHGCETYPPFVRLLESDPGLFHEFRNYITINVTSFFRDPDRWESLERDILPGLIEASNGGLIAWSIACSTGEEPYSVSMMLSRHLAPHEYTVIATDINEDVLAFAREGVYPEITLEGVDDALIERYFDKVTGGYAVKPEIRERVTFSSIDLLKDAYPSHCHLVLCRNVLIYFTPEAKNIVLSGVRECLDPNGCLFLGRAERILRTRTSHFRMVAPELYLFANR